MADLSLILAHSLTDIVLNSKGQAATIRCHRTIKRNDLSAGNKDRTIIKSATYNITWGVNRDNKKAVIEARANGTAPATNQGLRGMFWLVPHVVKQSLVNGYLHLACVPAKNKPASSYSENGVDIGYEGYAAAVIPSRLKPSSKPRGEQTFTIAVDGIEWIRSGGKEYKPVGGQFVVQ